MPRRALSCPTRADRDIRTGTGGSTASPTNRRTAPDSAERPATRATGSAARMAASVAFGSHGANQISSSPM